MTNNLSLKKVTALFLSDSLMAITMLVVSKSKQRFIANSEMMACFVFAVIV